MEKTAVEKTKVKKKNDTCRKKRGKRRMKFSCRKDKGEEEEWKIPVVKATEKKKNGKYPLQRQSEEEELQTPAEKTKEKKKKRKYL